MNDMNKHWYLCVIDMLDKETKVLDTLSCTEGNKKRVSDVTHVVNYKDKNYFCYRYELFII